jgi:tRNA(fMet)-specific endonuclease VapC
LGLSDLCLRTLSRQIETKGILILNGLSMTYLLDSNICIAAMKREPVVMARLDEFPAGTIALPSIVVAELSYGASKSQNVSRSLQALALLTDQVPTVPFDFTAAHYYGRIKALLQREGTPIGPNDYLIAAIALAQNSTLITRNVREFERIPGLRWMTF